MTKFIQRYVYRGKEVKVTIKTRMRQYNKIKAKARQVILPDPISLTKPIKRANIEAYYWMHSMTKNI